MRLLSSGSVTSAQLSVFLTLEEEEDLSFFEDDECLEDEDLEDPILEASFSVSEPDSTVVVLRPFPLLPLFAERVEDEGDRLLCRGVDGSVLPCPASSQSSCSSGCWTST
jgi:hypothetical protein